MESQSDGDGIRGVGGRDQTEAELPTKQKDNPISGSLPSSYIPPIQYLLVSNVPMNLMHNPIFTTNPIGKFS